MQKGIFYLFILLTFSVRSFAGYVTVTINPIECVSCTKHMDLLFKKKTTFPITFILEKKYQKDSSQIVKSLYLNDYKVDYVWSDSAYDALSINGISSITIFGSHKKRILSSPLKSFDEEKSRLFQKVASSCDTINLPQEIYRQTYHSIASDAGYIYFIDQLNMKVFSYDIFNDQANVSMKIDSSNVKKAFDLALGDGAYEFNMRELAKLQVPKILYLGWLSIGKDRLAAIGSYSCISKIVGTDTIVSGFYAINEFKDNKLDAISVFPDTKNVLGTFMIDGNDSFYSFPHIHLYKDYYYAYIRKFDPNKKVANTRFLGRFSRKDGVLHLDKVFDFKMPDIYRNGSYSKPIFFEQYAMLPLDGKIYSLTSEKQLTVEGLEFKTGKDFFDPPSKYIVDFSLDGSQINILYFVPESKEYHFTRYNSVKKKIDFDKPFSSGRQLSFLDKFDYNYVYYPISESQIVRKHFSEL